MATIDESELQWYINEIDRLRKINEDVERENSVLKGRIKFLEENAKGDDLYDEYGFEIRTAGV